MILPSNWWTPGHTHTHMLSVTFNQKILGLSIFHDVKHAYLAFLEFLVIQYLFLSWHIGSSALCTLGTLSQIWNPCCRSPANSRIMLVFERHLGLYESPKILFSTLNNSHRINLLHWINLHAHARFFKIVTPFHSVCVIAEVDQYINNCKTSRAFLSATTLSMLDTTPHTDPLESRAVEPDWSFCKLSILQWCGCFHHEIGIHVGKSNSIQFWHWDILSLKAVFLQKKQPVASQLMVANLWDFLHSTTVTG